MRHQENGSFVSRRLARINLGAFEPKNQQDQ
jgi:hypothetical protein